MNEEIFEDHVQKNAEIYRKRILIARSQMTDSPIFEFPIERLHLDDEKRLKYLL